LGSIFTGGLTLVRVAFSIKGTENMTLIQISYKIYIHQRVVLRKRAREKHTHTHTQHV